MLVYVAAPYSSIPDKVELMRKISKICGELMVTNPGEFLVPGLVHHYATVEVPDLGTEYSFWQSFCETFLSRCDSVMVLKFPGWDTSIGVKAEIDLAVKLGIPVRYQDIDDLVRQKPKYTLDELIAQTTWSSPSEEDQQWMDSPPVGRELL